VIITDMHMMDINSGVRILEGAVSRDIFTEVIVLTAYGNVANAVECMKRGAFDYVEKNLPGIDVFELIVLKVELAAQRRRQSVQTLRRLEDFQAAEIG
jgi:FixJ family two-component response regulator